MTWWQRLFGGKKTESISPEQTDPDLLERKIQGLKAEKWVERQATARELVAKGGYAALWGHARLLGDDGSSAKEVARARRALEEAGNLAVPALRAALQDHVQVSTAAAKRLADIGSPEALEALAATIGGEVSSGMFQKENGQVCAEQLLSLGAPSVPVLIKALGEGERLARIRAAETLGRILSEKGIKDPGVRGQAARALAETLKHEDRGVRTAAAGALATLGEGASFCAEALCDLLDDGSAASGALKAIGAPAGASLVARLSDPKRRRAALTTLREMGYKDPRIVSHIHAIWADPKERSPELLRYMASLSLAEFMGELKESLGGTDDKLVAETVRIILELRAVRPDLAAQLEPLVAGAARRAFDKVRSCLAEGKSVGEDEAMALASFEKVAREYTPVLQKDMERAGQDAMGNPWLIGALACMAADPKPYFAALLEPMRDADEGKVAAPMLRIGADGSVTRIPDVRQVYGGLLGNAFAFVAAWGANSPAMRSQNAMERVLSILGDPGRKHLMELKGQFPKQVDGLLSKRA